MYNVHSLFFVSSRTRERLSSDVIIMENVNHKPSSTIYLGIYYNKTCEIDVTCKMETLDDTLACMK